MSDQKLGVVFLVVRHDRHIDEEITVHETVEGADAAVEEFKTRYEGHTWVERSYGRPRWSRYVESHDDGPRARIEPKEVRP